MPQRSLSWSSLAALLTLSFATPTRAEVPTIATPVTDLAGVLDAAAETTISDQLIALRTKTGIQMAVLTVATLADRPIDDYAYEVFQEWGGGSRQRNDGILFVLAVNDRQSRLELGRGIEAFIPDGRARSLLDELRPHLRASEYGAATSQIVALIAAACKDVTPDGSIPAYSLPLGRRGPTLISVAVVAWLFGLFFMWHRAGQKKRRLPVAGLRSSLLVIPASGVSLVVWAVAPVLLFVLIQTDSSATMGAAYLATWYLFALLGCMAASSLSQVSLISRITFAIILAAIVSYIAYAQSAALSDMDPGLVLRRALIGGLIFLVVTGIFGPGGGGGGGGYYSSGSSGRSSSSSSSSSWSGGGGSSGGGGASSSW